MLSKKADSERFSKVLNKLNSTSDKTEQQRPPSSQNSFLQDLSIRSEKSTKHGSQVEARSMRMDESKALKMLLEQPEVLLNRQVVKIKTEFVPTSNGIRFVLLVADAMVNISWLHSVQELEPGKILLLYYDLKGLPEGKAKMESLILEAGRTQGAALCSALTLLHGKYHDQQVEKLYHMLC